MKSRILTIFISFIFNFSVSAQVWHVSGTGSDLNDGKSPQTAFRSLQKAADLVKPGDIVYVGDGIYTNSNKSIGSAVLSITSSGKPNAWITWKAKPGTHPEIRPSGWAGIQILASYHIIDGLKVTGSNDSLVVFNAQEDAKKDTPDPKFNTNGIFINGRTKKPDEKPHHIIIRNCTVDKCPGGGITAIETDYITIEDCKVYNNAWFMRYGGSGISTLDNWAHDDAPGYHFIIQRNHVFNNKTQVQWVKVGRLSDGNGIILDVTDQEEVQGATNINADAVLTPAQNQTTQPAFTEKPKRPEWKGRSLVANNLCAFNGGSGIHTFRNQHADIINNTTYCNGQMMGYPEMFANRSQDIVFLNNIIVPRPAGKVTGNTRNINVRWDYNLYPEEQNILKGTNDIVADPDFVKIEYDPIKCDFHLKKNSRALNSGSKEFIQQTDIDGKHRPKGPGVDRGAFEQ
jgi:hypothetical protein